jgi:N-acetylmuramic acid 6-phosphate etherase
VSEELIIGVDGGGTKTMAWLALREAGDPARVLGRGLAGPGNPRAAGFEVAQANMEAAIDAAFASANLPRTTILAACFGLAGAGRSAEQDRIANWAVERGIARHVKVTGDAEPILAAASPDNVGIALICGTGSMAWGRNREGATARAGGWGYLLGDEGSAYAIARAGLQAAVRAADGRSEPTALLDVMQRELDAATPQQLVERVYAPETTRERLASLAKAVFEAARKDAVALAIVHAAGKELALHIVVLCRGLGFGSGSYPLAFAGGVILEQSSLREKVLASLARDEFAPSEVVLVTEPARGAVALARQLVAM